MLCRLSRALIRRGAGSDNLKNTAAKYIDDLSGAAE